MKVFLSHARKDGALARQLADQLTRRGFVVWLSEDNIAPGDNWAKKTGKALDDAEWMVLLFTPAAMESDSLRQNIEFALGSRRYEGRVFSVFVGPTLEAGKDVPWILLKLPNRQVESAKNFGQVVKDIQDLVAHSDLSHSNA
ncbi:MAG: toll/interleukin-1 receptor domain-containing protein [Thermoguttaceae bacterium]